MIAVLPIPNIILQAASLKVVHLIYARQHREFPLIHLTQQLLLQNILILLILLRTLIRTIVLPAHHLAALATRNITHYMTASRHVALARFALLDIDDFVEEVGFAVLAAEILHDPFSSHVSLMDREVGEREHTLLMISSWSARWVLQFLQP
jgi:hypothetical protein